MKKPEKKELICSNAKDAFGHYEHKKYYEADEIDTFYEELLSGLKGAILMNYGDHFKDCYFIKADFVNKLSKELGWDNE